MVGKAFGVGILLVFGVLSRAIAADTVDVTKDVKEAQETIAVLKKADPSLSRFFDTAVGYAVFPTVTKGAVGVGGAAGSGVVFEKGNAIGKASLTQATVGAQLGGQTYSEIIFFETAPAFTDFKKGTFALAAQASAVAASAGKSANANYQNGVAVFTVGKGGLMAEASVGGQKFGFEPFAKK
jgi:Las17-binding protein actin regulator